MGLDTSHDCWHGAYSAFFRWRVELGRAAGFEPRHDPTFGEVWGLGPDGDVLNELLEHSDCDGELPWKICGPLADRLESLLPALSGDGGGHIGDYRKKTKQFIKGLREAAAAKENVEFH